VQTIFTIVSLFPSLLVLSMASTIIQQVVKKIKHNNYSLLYKSKTHLLAKTQEAATLLGLHSSH
jgi:hypothetical protein